MSRAVVLDGTRRPDILATVVIVRSPAIVKDLETVASTWFRPERKS